MPAPYSPKRQFRHNEPRDTTALVPWLAIGVLLCVALWGLL